MRRLAALGVLACACAACSGSSSRPVGPDLSVRVRPAPPPSPVRWPAYPRFSARSCWADGPGRPSGSAPSYAVARPGSPRQIARRLLARLGDRRVVVDVHVVPARPHLAGERPPADALWADIATPPGQTMRKRWEVALVGGALRDDFCAAGGAPLAGWSAEGRREGISQTTAAFGQRFPNPTAPAYRARVERIGRRFGFQVETLRLLRPLQVAPLLVVHTDRERTAFARDAAAIVGLLNPSRSDARTFEGLYFEARDGKGRFLRVANVYRGSNSAEQWAWDPCWYPYAWPRPAPAGDCPPGSTG